MSSFSEIYRSDLSRYGNKGASRYITLLLRSLRKSQTCRNRFSIAYNKLLYKILCTTHGLEIPWNTKIGKGLYLGHAYNITVNPNAMIGDNCSIYKGVLIGQTNRGHNKGVPIIGNRVWIGVNAAIVGGITVGDDVLIAPNSFVNRDIPNHSVVFGNPCMIKHRDNATEAYIDIF